MFETDASGCCVGSMVGHNFRGTGSAQDCSVLCPPSIPSTWHVIQRDFSNIRNTAISARSSGCPTPLRGCCPARLRVSPSTAPLAMPMLAWKVNPRATATLENSTMDAPFSAFFNAGKKACTAGAAPDALTRKPRRKPSSFRRPRLARERDFGSLSLRGDSASATSQEYRRDHARS